MTKKENEISLITDIYEIKLSNNQIPIQQILVPVTIKIMSKNYTPHTPQRQPKTAIRTPIMTNYLRNTPDHSSYPLVAAPEHALLKDYQSLLIQIRQLQGKNSSLVGQVEQLLMEKNYNDNKFKYKVSIDDQVATQLNKEKNYQMELLQIKHDEEISRLRRESELRSDQFLREIKHKDYQIREKDQQNRYLQMRNEQLRRDYQSLSLQFTKSRQQNSLNAETITRNEYTIKKLQMLIEQTQLQKVEMQSQIRTLLDIQDEKSIALSTLQSQLRQSQQNEQRLIDKLTVLSENFAELQNHITAMKQKLLSQEDNNLILNQKIDRLEIEIREKQQLLIQQMESENLLKIQYDQQIRRQAKREREVTELMVENQQLYKELNLTRHRLHDIAITCGVDI